MINIRFNAISKCYNTLLQHNNKGEEISGIKYLVSKLFMYCKARNLDSIEVENEMLASLLQIFDDELKEEKINYVKEKVDSSLYNLLPSNISLGIVCTIPSKYTLSKDGYSKDYIYMTAGSMIKNHKHEKEIEIYNGLKGNISNDGEYKDIDICGIHSEHEIKSVNRLTIIESFKVKKELLNSESIVNISKTLVKKIDVE